MVAFLQRLTHGVEPSSRPGRPPDAQNCVNVWYDRRDQQYKGWGTAFAAADLTINHFSHVMAIERAGSARHVRRISLIVQ
jgi:hypothetical protein